MSLLAPLGLLLGLLGLPITALYFLRLRRRRVVVPSLLLWHALQRQERRASPFDRFRRNLLLLLQLLVLSALSLALARPFVATERSAFRSLVLVIDLSASMNAQDGSPTRLDQARDEAREVLDTLGTDDEVMLVTAGPTTRVEVPFSRDRGELGVALDAVRATEAEGSLRESLQLALSLARTRPDVEIVVLSDGGNEALEGLSPGTADVRFVRVGGRSENAGIVALDLRRSPAQELDRQLFVTVRSFGTRPVQASVELYLDDTLLTVRSQQLLPDEPVPLVFDLDGGREGVLRVVLDTPDDVLPTDDEAFALLGRAETRDIVLVGADQLTARALAADPRVRLRVLPPAAATLDALSGVDAVFFLAGVPPRGTDGLNLALLSRRVAGPAQLGELVAMPGITRWERTHPTLRFVELGGATVARAARVGDRGGLVPIVESDAGPLVLAGERNGGRVLQLAFDPFETDLPMRVAWPVFLLNSVGWLTAGRSATDAASVLPTGAAWTRPAPGDSSAVARGPAGPVEVDRVAGQVRVLDTTRRGLYRVTVDGTTHRFAANLLSERESRVAPASALLLDERAPVDGQARLRSGRRELWRPLVGLALLFLLLEWFVYHRRRRA